MSAAGENAAYWLGRPGATAAAKARKRQAAVFRLERKLESAGLKMLAASGASGRELLPHLRRQLRG